MDAKQFNDVFQETMNKSAGVLVKKADEYATEDRLHNFKKSAHLKGETPRQALMGKMVKHTVSVYDMGMSTEIYPLELWDEKIIDHINYLILLRATVIEELEGEAE